MKKLYILLLAICAASFGGYAQELIEDGAFDNFSGVLGGRSAHEWGMWSDDGGTVIVTDNVAVATPGKANAAEPWHLQLEQWNEEIENDMTYVIKFSAYSDAERVIQITFEDPANGYALLGTTEDETSLEGRSKWDVPITTEMAEYTLTTTIDGIKDNSTIKFAFLLGTTTDVVYIDNVSMMDADLVETSVALNKMASVKVYPNPANSTLSVRSNAAFNSVRILNVAGQESLRSNSVSGIDVAGLNAGVYVVELMNEGKTVARSQFIKR